jgi:hypothetical protein
VQFSAHFCLLSVGFSLKVEERGLDKTRQKAARKIKRQADKRERV